MGGVWCRLDPPHHRPWNVLTCSHSGRFTESWNAGNKEKNTVCKHTPIKQQELNCVADFPANSTQATVGGCTKLPHHLLPTSKPDLVGETLDTFTLVPIEQQNWEMQKLTSVIGKGRRPNT